MLSIHNFIAIVKDRESMKFQYILNLNRKPIYSFLFLCYRNTSISYNMYKNNLYS